VDQTQPEFTGSNLLSPPPVAVAMRSKALDRGYSIAGIAGSNPPEGNDDRLLCLLCVVWVSTHECVCLVVFDLETLTTTPPRRQLGCCATESNPVVPCVL